MDSFIQMPLRMGLISGRFGGVFHLDMFLVRYLDLWVDRAAESVGGTRPTITVGFFQVIQPNPILVH